MLEYLEALLSSKRVRTVGTIPEDPAIAISWLVGEPLASAAQADMDLVVHALEALEIDYATANGLIA